MCKILCLWKTRVLQDMHFGNRKYQSKTKNVASTHNITVIIYKRVGKFIITARVLEWIWDEYKTGN